MALRACSLLLVLLACSPPAQPTPDGGPCRGDTALPANLLANPGFECGASLGWWAQYGTLSEETATVHGGQKAARLLADSTSSAAGLWLEEDAVPTPGTSTYCLRAWLRGTAANGRLTLRKVTALGGTDENFSSPISDTAWTLLPPASFGPLKVVAQNEERFLLRVAIPSPKEGDVLLIDDVELWISADGSCNEQR